MRKLALICTLVLPAIAQSPSLRLPNESVGVNGIVRTLISAFDQVDIVALGEAHQRKEDSDLRIALVRSPDFAKKVHCIVVEFASTTEQSTLDRYIRGENVSPTELAQVWKTTTQAANGIWDSPVYAEFLAAVRDVNSKLPLAQQIRVIGGDPGPGDNRTRETAAVEVIKQQVLEKHEKAVVVYGMAHFYRALPPETLTTMAGDIGIATTLERTYPGRTLSVIRIGLLDRPRALSTDLAPNLQEFDHFIKTPVRPVLVSLQRPPFRDLTAEEFLGRTVITCRPPGACRSVFQGSTLTLGQMADACIYYGSDPYTDTRSKPIR